MKKLGLAILAGSLLATSAFAAELTISGTLVDTHALGQKATGTLAAPTHTEAYGLGKSRVVLGMKADDKVTVTYIGKLDGKIGVVDALTTDYVYADIITDLGKVRAGTMYQNIANFGGGVYQTNTFLTQVVCKGLGIALANKISDYNVNVFNIGSAIGGDSNKVYGAKVDTVMSGVNLAAVVQAVIKNDTAGDMKTGPAIELEASYKVADAKISGQYYTDLNDEAALAHGAVLKASYIGIYGEYNLASVMTGLNVYADYVSGSGDGRTLDSELKVGLTHACTAKVAVNLEAKSLKKINGDSVGSTGLGLQVKF